MRGSSSSTLSTSFELCGIGPYNVFLLVFCYFCPFTQFIMAVRGKFAHPASPKTNYFWIALGRLANIHPSIFSRLPCYTDRSDSPCSFFLILKFGSDFLFFYMLQSNAFLGCIIVTVYWTTPNIFMYCKRNNRLIRKECKTGLSRSHNHYISC